jgi:hypothetical protein
MPAVFTRIIHRAISSAAPVAGIVLLPLSIFAQTAAPPAPQSTTAQTAQPACSPLSDTGIPMDTTLQAKVKNGIDAAHLKPGKEIWVNSVYSFVYPDCRLETDAAIYAHVTSASASKNPSASELSLQFDRADCNGHSKQPLKLVLMGIVAPPDDSRNLHDAVPTELRGGSRQISDAAANMNAYDAQLSAGGPAHTVKPGAVVGLKNVTLDPRGGPTCSSRLTSTSKNIELQSGTILILAATQ